MNLNSYAAQKRLALFDDLSRGAEPREGSFDMKLLKEARTKGAPQLGSTRFAPDAIHFEFVYPNPGRVAIILTVTVSVPERIVFMPVPSWVVENIWQGEVDGSYHFESEAKQMAAELGHELEEGPNRKWFGPRQAKRRE